jgi:hypothetical protein
LVNASRRIRLASSLSSNAWVHNRFEVEARFVTRENHFSHGRSIQMTRRIDSRFAKLRSYFFQRWFTRLNNFAGNNVRIDNRYAEFCEHVGNGRFAAGDAAGQANS